MLKGRFVGPQYTQSLSRSNLNKNRYVSGKVMLKIFESLDFPHFCIVRKTFLKHLSSRKHHDFFIGTNFLVNFWEICLAAEVNPSIESISNDKNRAFLERKVQNFADDLIKLT
jgi:hypothetical protein